MPLIHLPELLRGREGGREGERERGRERERERQRECVHEFIGCLFAYMALQFV